MSRILILVGKLRILRLFVSEGSGVEVEESVVVFYGLARMRRIL